jgi:glycosyltransferase involved in cell wall biosynthesis
MRIGIDASNLRQGGGITHLVQLLSAADPDAAGMDRVVVWGAPHVLAELPDRPWLDRRVPPGLSSRTGRVDWQHRRLAEAADGAIDLLFVPGGAYLGRFRPFVTMFRNMLPFDRVERRRYGASRMRVKMEMLRAVQRRTFGRADGVIFLTKYAQQVVAADGVAIGGRTAVIPHGIESRFFAPPRVQRPLREYSSSQPFRWLYVGVIHDYKRPWHVAEAIACLRRSGAPVTLDFVGPAYPPALQRLEETVARLDPSGSFIRIGAEMSHVHLARHYPTADAFVFASTCENMPNCLLEAMAAGLPIACSDREPMRTILHDGGVYFDPEQPAAIARAMRSLMSDASERATLAARAHERATQYDWARCARDTFAFLAAVGGR